MRAFVLLLMALAPVCGVAAQPVLPVVDTTALDAAARVSVERAFAQFRRGAATVGETSRELGMLYGRYGMTLQAWQLREATALAYTRAVELAADDPHWPYYLAVHHEEIGELETALTWYGRVGEMIPTFPFVWLRTGEVALELNRLDQAEDAFRRALQIDPNLIPATAGLGTVALRRQDYATGIPLLLQALEKQPEAGQLHYRLALAYRNQGDLTRAREHLAKRNERIASAPDPWLEIMKAKARPPEYFVGLGLKQMEQNELRAAVQSFNLALSIDERSADAYVGIARTMLKAGNRPAAAQAARRALGIAPGHTGATALLEEIERR